ncbi:hypothetical protein LEN26_020322 [Aphanomyces euteiches]|nr:hypothetical protein LEN26_020322 [Aphanomyces euteiches]KAH9103488.1 hypothetical protein AeMF1_020167 [Aphanomyces euteiches]KAH9181203.1 hypothetical protein AeNC1_016821 [Aphanomyces euteiches]
MSAGSVIWQGVPNATLLQGEYTTMGFWGTQEGTSRFQQHRSNFITNNDVRQVAQANLNTVRVPVGFWIQGCDQFPSGVLKDHCNRYAKGGLDFLDTLIRNWAWKYNVAVLISLHGAPGSQNGHDHSGAEDSHVYWSQYPENVKATVNFAAFLAQRYKNDDAFLGIGLLNEPVEPVDMGVLLQYYRDAYSAVRAVSDCILTHMPLLSHQSPGHGDYMDDFAPEMTNVWHEWHPYVRWGYESMTEDQLMNQGVAGRVNDVKNWKGKPMFLGEWSFSTPDGTFNNLSRWGVLAASMMGLTNNAAAGWTFWAWKEVGSDTDLFQYKWSLKSLLNFGNSFSPTANEKTITIYNSNGKSLTTRSDPWRLVNDKTWIREVGRATEWWYDATIKSLRSNLDGQCLDGYPTQNGQFAVHSYGCAPGNQNQVWTLTNHAIIHGESKLCLTASLTLVTCDSTKTNQYFNIGTERAQIRGPNNIVYSTGNGDIQLNGDPHPWIIDHAKLTIKDTATGKCLDAYQPQNGGIVHCTTASKTT